ncbi:MAG: plastocyanin/azurin family copper-binding protein [Gemmatimonadota bacterium]|nr:plastocyanin/azurin family copper-binding protein [Gemmatimonadota bacterium]MDH4349465.1 plastocyanin/azurin family copper-binding protein [Gemmatimonadota bacterium]MDH5283892.1 plastocyanin/azurin family copper-binding protein [Gemmatimonadota bacterium]
MRAMMMVVGVAATLVGCGKGGEQQQAEQQAAPAAEAAAPAMTGATHEVAMEFDGKVGSFVPAELTIKAGDVVKFVVKSGPPHNVAFWSDSIPAGAADVLNSTMKETMAPLTGPLKVGMGEAYEMSFAGAPAGEYKYFCTPHLTFGMKAKITVQ